MTHDEGRNPNSLATTRKVSMSGILQSEPSPGDVIRNAWLTIGDPGLAEMVASSAAVDAVTLDLQHGEIAGGRVPDLIRAIELGGAESMARLAGPDPALVARLLDLGVSGLIMPTVSTVSTAEDFVNWTRHPPRGSRSFGAIRASGRNDGDPALWAMIETDEGLESAGDIAAVDGIHGLFIGPGDLGLSLGIGVGQNRTEPEFLDAVSRIRQAAEGSGCGLGIHCTDIEYSKEMIASGFNLVTIWVDVVAIHSSLRTVEQGLNA